MELDEDKDEVKTEIANLLDTVPVLNEVFEIHHKVGVGAFSTVYKASLKNTSEKKYFAIKHLIPTCHPGRIHRELKCLKEIGNKDHVVGIDLCIRHAGSVVFVMPYMRHDRFSDYIFDMDVTELKGYMRALLTAIRRVHQFSIIHRDIKPNNFLYDRSNRRYLLVDFGLAQQYKVESKSESLSHSTTGNKKSGQNSTVNANTNRDGKKPSNIFGNKCNCFGKSQICSICMNRAPQVAPRAGTPGYRAPEVLLKYAHQTPAIDIWASGVIMLCILTKTQPFFQAPDDMTALAEITNIFGTTAMEQLGKKLGKKLTFSRTIPKIDLVSMCQSLQSRKRNLDKATKEQQTKVNTQYPLEAYQLLGKLLDIDHKNRITAEKALSHSFFS